MTIPHEHTNKTLVKNLATKGGASKNITATFAVASEAEQAAKSPIAGPVDKNFIENALYDQDSRYPGAGGRVHDWAGFAVASTVSGSPTNTFPITFIVGQQNFIRFYGFGNFGQAICRVTLQNAAYPNTSYSLIKDLAFSGSDDNTNPHQVDTTITDGELTALNTGSNTITFNSAIVTLLDLNGNPKPGSDGDITLMFMKFFSTGSVSIEKTVAGWDVFGGAKIIPGTYRDVTPYALMQTHDDSEFGHDNVKASSNGIGSWWAGNRMPQHWKHYCPLYTANDAGGNYDTYHGKRFFRIRKNKNTYEDIASLHNPLSSLPNTSNNGYDLGPLQGRAIELFGSGGRVVDRNDDFDKSYPDIPNFSATTGAVGSSTWGSYLASNNYFMKHSVCQSVKIPDGAVSAKYGAYVQCPKGDSIPLQPPPLGQSQLASYTSFNGKNWGAIQLSQDYGRGQGAVPNETTNARYVRADAIRFANQYMQGFNYLPDATQEIGHFSGASGTSNLNYAQYNFNGLASVYSAAATAEQIEANNNNTSNVHPHGFRYPTSVHATSVTYNDYDYEEFKLVERTWKRADQTGYSTSGWHQASDLDDTDTHYNTYLKQIPYLQLELVFYEHASHLEVVGPLTGTNYITTGKIRFFSPFVQFFDANGDIISPS